MDIQTYNGKRLVLMSNEVPLELIERAQVVIISDGSTHIIGPHPYRMAIYEQAFILPPMNCPKIDVRGLADEDVAMVVAKYIRIGAGVTDLKALKEAMIKIGAKINE